MRVSKHGQVISETDCTEVEAPRPRGLTKSAAHLLCVGSSRSRDWKSAVRRNHPLNGRYPTHY